MLAQDRLRPTGRDIFLAMADQPGSRYGPIPGYFLGGRMDKVNLAEAFGRFADLWSPKIVATLDDYDVKLAKLKGEFVWHQHAATDEFFLVVKGNLRIQQRDRDVELGEGELYVVPRGVEHCPIAHDEAHVLIFVRKGTVNTGNLLNERTVPADQRL
jgi:mannose-6-phosphate isomerase-like protein (cupin superfamily)